MPKPKEQIIELIKSGNATLSVGNRKLSVYPGQEETYWIVYEWHPRFETRYTYYFGTSLEEAIKFLRKG